MNFGSDDSLHAWKESSKVEPRFVLQGKKKDEARNTLMSSAKHLGKDGILVALVRARLIDFVVVYANCNDGMNSLLHSLLQFIKKI